jgi:hypothetical protein
MFQAEFDSDTRAVCEYPLLSERLLASPASESINMGQEIDVIIGARALLEKCADRPLKLASQGPSESEVEGNVRKTAWTTLLSAYPDYSCPNPSISHSFSPIYRDCQRSAGHTDCLAAEVVDARV